MTEIQNTTIPALQLPTSCHVCGTPAPKREGASRPDCWHDFTNAEADAQAAAYDRRATFRYSTGATTPEAHAVETFAPEAVAR